MATHFSVLAWRIPGTVEPGGLLSMGSHRVGHDWSDLAAAAAISYSRESSRPRDRACASLHWQGHSLPLSHQGSPFPVVGCTKNMWNHWWRESCLAASEEGMFAWAAATPTLYLWDAGTSCSSSVGFSRVLTEHVPGVRLPVTHGPGSFILGHWSVGL